MINYNKRESIPDQGKLIGKINYKPNGAFVVIAIFATLLLLIHSVASTVLAILLYLLVVCGILFIKDRTILEVYEKSLILYDQKDHSLAALIPLSSISKWDTSRSSSFSTALYTNDPDNPIIEFECFSTGKVINYLKEVMPEKQAIQMGIEMRRTKK